MKLIPSLLLPTSICQLALAASAAVGLIATPLSTRAVDYVPSLIDAQGGGTPLNTATKLWLPLTKSTLLIDLPQGSEGFPHDDAGRFVIGGSVAIDPAQASMDANKLSWVSSGNGWKVAQFSVRVQNAAALSLAMFISAPKNAGTLAYASISSPAEEVNLDRIKDDNNFQTPPTSGDTVVLELRLHEEIKPSLVTMKLSRVFDYWMDPQRPVNATIKTPAKSWSVEPTLGELVLSKNRPLHTAFAPHQAAVEEVLSSASMIPDNLGWSNYGFYLTSFSLPYRVQARPLGCHMDVACRDYLWGTPYNGVVKITFTYTPASGVPSIATCTGTLLNSLWPSDAPGAVPGGNRLFVATARHCIETDAQARSVSAYWFYQVPSERMACLTRSTDLPFSTTSLPATYTRTASGGYTPALHPVTPIQSSDLATGMWRSSGAQLLWAAPHTDPSDPDASSSDIALLRLRDVPNHVDYVGFFGGDFTLPQNRDNVISVHHPFGDVKKTSRGTIVMETPGDDYGQGMVGPDYSMHFEQGGIESGSSGGGLFARVDAAGDHHTDPVFVGLLTGGSTFPYDAKCQRNYHDNTWEYAETRYAQFKAVFGNLSHWLAPTAAEEPMVRAELSVPF